MKTEVKFEVARLRSNNRGTKKLRGADLAPALDVHSDHCVHTLRENSPSRALRISVTFCRYVIFNSSLLFKKSLSFETIILMQIRSLILEFKS